MDLSVIVPTFNRAERLRRNLLSLSYQTLPHGSYEVIVIDDGSTDDTKAVIEAARASYDYRLRSVYLPRPYYCNPALAWNVGIRRSAAPVVVFMGADIIAARNALERLTSYLADADEDAYIFGQCYRVHSPMTNALLDHYKWYEDIHVVLGDMLVTPFHHSSYWHVPMLAAIHKSRLEAIRGYDESYVEPWPEDEDCWVRLQATGVYGINALDVWGAHQYHPQQDPPCYRGCPCPLWQKSGTWPHREAKYDGLPEDIQRNPGGWGECPGMIED
jgi:glycosyltransferase involved in cell wall biosynthesis